MQTIDVIFLILTFVGSGVSAVIHSDSDYSPFPERLRNERPFVCHICLSYWYLCLTLVVLTSFGVLPLTKQLLLFAGGGLAISNFTAIYVWRLLNR